MRVVSISDEDHIDVVSADSHLPSRWILRGSAWFRLGRVVAEAAVGEAAAKGGDRAIRRVLPLRGRQGLTHLEPSLSGPEEAWVAVRLEPVEAAEASEGMTRTARC